MSVRAFECTREYCNTRRFLFCNFRICKEVSLQLNLFSCFHKGHTFKASSLCFSLLCNIVGRRLKSLHIQSKRKSMNMGVKYFLF